MKKKQELKSLFLKFRRQLYNIERVAYLIVLETKSKPDARILRLRFSQT
jgi:hypothetical protein